MALYEMSHPHIMSLAHGLQIPQYSAFGIINALLVMTAKFAPRGNIGKWSNDSIAHGVGWKCDEDHDSYDFIRILVDIGFLRHDPEWRLLVAEWEKYAPNETKIKLVRDGITTFCNGTRVLSNQHLRIDDGTGRSRRRERIRRAGGEPTKKMRSEVYERDRYQCRQCGSADDLTIDHIVPVSADGKTEPTNLQTLCRPCNSSKRDRVEPAQQSRE